MFDEIKLDRRQGLIEDRPLELKFYIESMFDSNIKQVLPDSHSIRPHTVYDICSCIYDTIERYYNEYGIYVYPYIAVEKQSNLFMDISTVSLYKLYSILTGCNIHDIEEAPISYHVDYDHSNMSYKCIYNITIVFSNNTEDKPLCELSGDKIYTKDFTLNDISDSDRAVVYAILSTMSYEVNILPKLNEADFIYRDIDEGEMEFQFYTTMGSNSICINFLEEKFHLDLVSNNVRDLILYAKDLRDKYNKRIFIPNAHLCDFDTMYLDTLLIKTLLLEFLDIPYNIRNILLKEQVAAIYFTMRQDDTNRSFGFYTTDNINGIHIMNLDGEAVTHIEYDDLNLTDDQKYILSIIYDLHSDIHIAMTEDQFKDIIQ